MNSEILNLVGIIINAAASVVLITPNLSVWQDLDDEFILSPTRPDRKFFQKKHVKNQKINIIGFALLLVGTLLQLGSALMIYCA